MAQYQCSRRHDVSWWGGLTLPSQDVENDIGGMDALGDRLGTGRLDGRQTVGQNRVEDVDHLPIATRMAALETSQLISFADFQAGQTRST